MQKDQVAQMFAAVLDEYGRIDILVDNAGIQVAKDTDKPAVEDFDRSWRSTSSVLICAQHAARGGRVNGIGPAYITRRTIIIDGRLTLYPSFETTWSSE